MSKGSVNQHFSTTLKITRLIGGGSMSELNKSVEEFVSDANTVIPIESEACVEANRAGLCVSLFLRCKDFDEMSAVKKKFKEHGWRV